MDHIKLKKDFVGLLAPRKTVPRKSGPAAQPKKEKTNPSRFFDQYEQTRSSPSKSKSNLPNGSSTKLKSKGSKTKMSRYGTRRMVMFYLLDSNKLYLVQKLGLNLEDH